MELDLMKFKVGDVIKIRTDLPIDDSSFKMKSPGWIDQMDEILGMVGRVDSVEPTCYEVTFPGGLVFFISPDYIDEKATLIHKIGNKRLPEKGDWVVYFESEEDREIATLGKVTEWDPDKSEWSVDGCPGFYFVYLFEGDVRLIDDVRAGKL